MTQKLSSPILSLVRKNILNMKPYSSARDEFKGTAEVYLDANENPYPTLYNRYPDPLQLELKKEIGKIKKIRPTQLFLGNGSDEAIDLLIRAFCEPNQDAILIAEPTYGMYTVCAAVNAVRVQRVTLTEKFDIDVARIMDSVDFTTKIIFLCSPNNPSGNLLTRSHILDILNRFQGLVVVDEAYIDFASQASYTNDLATFENLVILQTFSKAWGLAGLRLGMCMASEEIINVLNKIKYPYNVNIQTQQLALEALKNKNQTDTRVKEIIQERNRLANELKKIKIVEMVFPSDANFLLVRVTNAKHIYELLILKGIIIRDRSNVVLCDNCLRITVGTPSENILLIDTLRSL